MKSLQKYIIGLCGIVALLCGGETLFAQTAAEVFVDAPQSIFPVLSLNNKKDLIDRFEAKRLKEEIDLEVENEFKEKSKLLYLSDAKMELLLDKHSKVELCILPLKGSKEPLIAVIRKSLIVPEHSVLSFYNVLWEKEDITAYMPLCSLDTFVRNNSSDAATQIKQLISQVGSITTSLTFMEEKKRFGILVSLTGMDKIALESGEPAKSLLKREKVAFWWNNKRFVEEK
ncbi:MAG: DUF3256 family protein [Porphyromonas sp.]|nr:DUF3256 family protein [Porphyromonas sp.]